MDKKRRNQGKLPLNISKQTSGHQQNHSQIPKKHKLKSPGFRETASIIDGSRFEAEDDEGNVLQFNVDLGEALGEQEGHGSKGYNNSDSFQIGLQEASRQVD